MGFTAFSGKAVWAAGSVSMLCLVTACNTPTVGDGNGLDPAAPSVEITVPDPESTTTTAPEATTTTAAAEPTTTTAAEATTTTAAPEPEAAAPAPAPAPEPAPAPAPAPAPGASNVEQEVIRLTNIERAKNNCPAFTADAKLTAAAQAHSRDMINQNYFSHTGLNGSSPGDRIGQQGYAFRGWAENIAKGQQTAEEVVTGWMNSPGHRRNILNCQLTEIGVGEHQRAWTQVFGTPA